jgi:hypothetical protein
MFHRNVRLDQRGCRSILHLRPPLTCPTRPAEDILRKYVGKVHLCVISLRGLRCPDDELHHCWCLFHPRLDIRIDADGRRLRVRWPDTGLSDTLMSPSRVHCTLAVDDVGVAARRRRRRDSTDRGGQCRPGTAIACPKALPP